MAIVQWERQKCDDSKSWPAFVSYRDQVPPRRMLVFTARGKLISEAQLAEWAAKNNWAKRCEAFDAHLSTLRSNERSALLYQSADDVTAHHMAMLACARDIISREFERIRSIVVASDAPTVSIPDLTRLLEAVVKTDRLIRDQSTENLNVSAPDFSRVSDEDLARIEAMLSGESSARR